MLCVDTLLAKKVSIAILKSRVMEQEIDVMNDMLSICDSVTLKMETNINSYIEVINNQSIIISNDAKQVSIMDEELSSIKNKYRIERAKKWKFLLYGVAAGLVVGSL